MAHPILMPKPGQMTEECVLTVWHKREGDPVRKGDVLFEIETDKSNMDVEAFEEGVLLKRYVEEGATVPVNAVCAYIGEPGEDVPATAPVLAPVAVPEAPTAEAASAPAAAATAAPSRAALAPPARTPVSVAAPGERAPRLRISPRASRLAAEAGLDPRSISGSGPGGRIVERDIRAALEAQAHPSGAPAGAPPAMRPAAAAAEVAPVPGEEPARPLSRMRQTIARRLTLSVTTIPHFTVTVAVDVTRLQALRQRLKAEGLDYSVTDFILVAAAQALTEHPDVNSRTDGEMVWPRRSVHLGLAVALPTGLVVPVIRDAERLSLAGIRERSVELVTAAREGRLGPDDMTGSTFTVSNLGMFGVEEFSAIINPGESAILAVASAIPTPVVVGEGIAIRSLMKVTLSADHRLVDGELGARFLGAVRRRLESPEALV